MKRLYTSARSLLSNLRPFAIALACALVLFSNATPAFAILGFGDSNSSPKKGLEQLDEVQNKSEEAISGQIDNANDQESVIKNSKEGLNGVQGAANAQNMKNPANSGATSVEESIKEALEDVTP